MTMRGLSAAYWLLKTNPWMKAGDTILLHAAAGGVGLIASQWAKLLGLRVIGTVSTEAKAELAKAHGCDEIIFYRREDVAERVKELTGGEGVTHRLRHGRQGHLRRFAEVAQAARRAGRLRHRLGPVPADRRAAAGDPGLGLFHASGARRLTSPTRPSAPSCRAPCSTMSPAAASRSRSTSATQLDDAVQAHRDLEAGKTTGSSIFVI